MCEVDVFVTDSVMMSTDSTIAYLCFNNFFLQFNKCFFDHHRFCDEFSQQPMFCDNFNTLLTLLFDGIDV